MNMAKDLANKLLKQHEGLKLKAYKDTEGKTTIGFGRNLDQVGISLEEANMLLDNDIDIAEKELRKQAFYKKLNIVRQTAVIDMVFNLGYTKFLGFTKFISYLDQGKYEAASKEMLRSKWAKQVGQRANNLSEMIRTGEYDCKNV